MNEEWIIKLLLEHASDGDTGTPEILAAIEAAEDFLISRGWRRDGLTGAEWIKIC
jgi:hypothetical protein